MSTFWKGSFKIALWVGGILLVVGGVLRIFFVTPITAGHDAMAPTLLASEKVLLWRDAEIEMGDIVVCENPREPGSMVIGRVAGKGGMRLETGERDQFFIGGTRVDVDWQPEEQFYDVDSGREHTVKRGVETMGNTEHFVFYRKNYEFRLRPTDVPAGKLFLLSDNRANRAHDSRTFGPVDQSTCLGTVFMRWNPEERGAIEHGWLDWLD